MIEVLVGFLIFMGLVLVTIALNNIADALHKLADNELKIRGVR